MRKKLIILIATILLIFVVGCATSRQLVMPIEEVIAWNEKAMAFCSTSARTLPEKPFHTDGCSMSLDGDWQQCCITHDIAYWCGGSREDRREADRALASCVAEQGHPIYSRFMYGGVRTGGLSILPTPWRWGYGHRWPQSDSSNK